MRLLNFALIGSAVGCTVFAADRALREYLYLPLVAQAYYCEMGHWPASATELTTFVRNRASEEAIDFRGDDLQQVELRPQSDGSLVIAAPHIAGIQFNPSEQVVRVPKCDLPG